MGFDTEDIAILEGLTIATGSSTVAINNLTVAVNNSSNLAQIAAEEANVATTLAASVLAAAQIGNPPLVTDPTPSTLGSITNIAVTSVNTQLLATNSNRKSFIVWNSDTYPISVSLGQQASVNLYSFKVNSGSYMTIVGFTGVVNACTPPTLSSSALITELT